MKALVYILSALAIICFGAALMGYWWQGITGGLASLLAYVINQAANEEKAARKAKEIE